jgi:hypothetical protein
MNRREVPRDTIPNLSSDWRHGRERLISRNIGLANFYDAAACREVSDTAILIVESHIVANYSQATLDQAQTRPVAEAAIRKMLR